MPFSHVADALAPGAEMVRVLRVLCREDFSIQSAKMFAADLKMAIEWLDAHFIYTPEQACLEIGATSCRWSLLRWFPASWVCIALLSMQHHTGHAMQHSADHICFAHPVALLGCCASALAIAQLNLACMTKCQMLLAPNPCSHGKWLCLQLEQLQENYEKKVPLGPHGSVRPNKQTLEDIKKNGKAEIAVKHTDLLEGQ